MPSTPRALHFYTDMSGYTSCGKSTSRVRATSGLRNWDSPIIARGERCHACADVVALIRPATTSPQQ